MAAKSVEKAPMPTLNAVKDKLDRKRLLQLFERRWALKQQIDEAEREIKEDLNPEIEILMSGHNLKSVDMGDYTVGVQNGVSVQITKTALLNLGVDPDIINRATSRKEYTTVMVRAKKVGGDGAED